MGKTIEIINRKRNLKRADNYLSLALESLWKEDSDTIKYATSYIKAVQELIRATSKMLS